MFLKEEETLDNLIIGDLKIIQPKKGYRFSIDAVLLAHFCRLEGVKTVIDLGTGSGVIPLILSQRDKEIKIKGVEIQPSMVDRAGRSIQLNRLEGRIEIIPGDIKKIKEILPAACAELIVCNPPFWRKNEGRISQNEEEAIARHELEVDLETVAKAAAYLLAPGGRFAFIQRAARFLEGVKALETNKLGISRVRWVHAKKDQPAKLVLVEGIKNKSSLLQVLPPLFIYEDDGDYCAELKEIYGR
ncbi:tRNA1Val (adenine37-N6)-methyltransferase [Thermosyntropha lipolytica DSM 11003]|uniref:tRNA1Val (Adenine37-N6)-methyltransferase n=1 Tax=Thermosyntropha lipolytica DSM 11003 TaxID=1123382 RepID=A0A1M5JML7_9FIRM|nr:tRNA1Val (adenine37-N6)-methyltransferase [Thermosyntropha lipolytica DSM 11003]